MTFTKSKLRLGLNQIQRFFDSMMQNLVLQSGLTGLPLLFRRTQICSKTSNALQEVCLLHKVLAIDDYCRT